MILRLTLLLLCCLASLVAGDPPPAEMKRVRELAAGGKSKDEAVAMCVRIADDDKRPADERARARRLLPVLLLNAGHPAEAKAEAARLVAAAPGQRQPAGLAEVLDAMILAKEKEKRSDAITALRSLAGDTDVLVKARASYQLALLLSQTDKGKPAPAEAQAEVLTLAETSAAGSDDPWDARQSLRLAREAAERARDLAGQERILRVSLRDPVLSIIDARERDDTTARLGTVIEEAKRFAEARTLYEAEIARASAALDAVRAEAAKLDPRQVNDRSNAAISALARWRFMLCRSWKNEGNLGKAMLTAEDVYSADCDPNYEWNAAQGTVIECLAAEPDKALAAARTWYEANGGGEGMKTYARLLAKGDGKQEKALVAWLEHGSAGPDGITGTTDDLADPKIPTARASYPARAALARSIPLDSGYRARRRANLLLFAGEPAEAAAVVRWWMGQTRLPGEVGSLAETMSRCASAVSSDPATRRRTLRYLADGPAGPDGKSGTPDDLADPWSGVTAYAPPAPTGEDAVLLRRLRAASARIAGDDRAQGNLRGNALATVQRIDMLFSARPSTEELLSWYEGNPGGIMDALAAGRFADDGHLANLPDVLRLLDGLGFDKQPDWVRGRRKGWPDLQAELHAGKQSKAWW
jgi:hypothetical protein